MKNKQAARKEISTLMIAATYIGTIVGAGFASGQEVLQFFGYFGVWGIPGLALATTLFILFGYLILDAGRQLKAKSHLPVIRRVGGVWLGTAIDGVITFFLFGALAVMAAGSGAIFVQQFGLSALSGSSFLLVATAITVMLGINGVISAISFVVPLLLVSVLGISIFTVATNPGVFWHNLTAWSQTGSAAAGSWPIAAVLYTSYNLVLGVAILAPLGALSKPEHLRSGAILGGIGLGVGALAITVALITSVQAARYEVPMLFIAGKVSPMITLGYSLILLAEVYTTAVGSLYGFAARVADPESHWFHWLILGTSFAAFAAAQFGFSSLVGVLFPMVGYAGLLLLGSIGYSAIKPRFPGVFHRLRVVNPIYKKRLRHPSLTGPGALLDSNTPEKEE